MMSLTVNTELRAGEIKELRQKEMMKAELQALGYPETCAAREITHST